MSRKGENVVLGIMGLGVVGNAARDFFEQQGHELRPYDPYKGVGSSEAINEANIVFICVPTPYTQGVGFDDRALEDAVTTLRGSKTIVIKSTVLPRTTERYQLRFPQHRFLFNPEFLREASAVEDFRAPDRQIVGYTQHSEHVADQIMALLPKAPYMKTMPAREAELTKYMTNAFLALKVTYANEIYNLTNALDIDYNVVRDAVAADARIGPSHLDVLDGGQRGYAGKCLPKDTRALIDLANDLGLSFSLLQTADLINTSLLKQNERSEVHALRFAGETPEAGAGEEEVAA